MKLGFCLIFIGLTTIGFSQTDIKIAGIADNEFFPHAQEKTNWCWAASIQMVLEYKNIFKTQEEIIERTFGRNYQGQLPNLGGSVETISNNLNDWEVDIVNRPMEVKSVFFPHPPSPKELIYFLKDKQPIYISYKSSLSTNHAIVITSCRYKEVNGVFQILDFTARDPWPSSENIREDGLVKYNYTNFYPLLNFFWIVSVRLKGNISIPYQTISECELPFCTTLNTVLSDYSNDFDNLKGKKINDRMFRSNIAFPDEKSSIISEYRGLNFESSGKGLPHYSAIFYNDDSYDNSRLAYENLKSHFQFLDIPLEETTRIPFDKDVNRSQNKTIHMHLGDGKVISLYWNYISSQESYIVKLSIESDKEIKEMFR